MLIPLHEFATRKMINEGYVYIAADSNSVKNPDCGCQLLTVTDYTDMMWTTLAEFPGTL